MCMTQPYMFLSSVILGPHNSKSKIDVYLQPVIDELKILWNEGVDTYDVHLNQTSKMWAAVDVDCEWLTNIWDAVKVHMVHYHV